MRTRGCIVVLALLSALSGCAKYEYNLVKPEAIARHIGRGTDEVFAVDPLEYRARTVDNRLVLRVFNPNPGPELLMLNVPARRIRLDEVEAADGGLELAPGEIATFLIGD